MSTLIWIIFGVVVLFLVKTMIVITQQQHVKLIETFGKFSNVKNAGLSFKMPWPIQAASSNFSLQIMEIGQDVGVKSSDNAFVTVPIRVQYLVDANEVQSAFYKLNNPVGQIKSYIVNQVRSTASGLTFEQLFQSKAAFEADVAETLAAKMREYGYTITNVLVDDPQPSDELREAFDRVLASKRLREAADNEGEAEKILRVKQAEAEADAMRLKAKGFSDFRKTVAKGNAEAMKSFTEGTDLSETVVLEFFQHINEMEALRDAAASGGKTVLVTGGQNPVLSTLADFNQTAEKAKKPKAKEVLTEDE